MNREPSSELQRSEQDRQIAETLARERPRLRNFIRKHAPSRLDAEDILQDVFSEFVEAYRLLTPIQQAGAWLFRVARNRIIDRFRRQRTEDAVRAADGRGEDEELLLDELPSPDAGPDAVFARRILVDELAAALAELPAEQREVFIAHEVEGRSFRELAESTGVNQNTLLARKRYAVLRLRERLQNTYTDLTST